MITLIKNYNSLDSSSDFEIRINKTFFNENKKELINRIKALKLKFKVNFIEVDNELIHNIFEIDNKINEQINNKVKENIIKNIPVEQKNDKSYRRKIKKKIVQDPN